MDFVANDMKFDYFIIKQWGGRFKVQGSGYKVQGSGFKVQGSGFRVQGSGFRVQGSGFRVVVAASPRIYIGRCPKVVFKVSNPHFKWGFIWNPSGVLY